MTNLSEYLFLFECLLIRLNFHKRILLIVIVIYICIKKHSSNNKLPTKFPQQTTWFLFYFPRERCLYIYNPSFPSWKTLNLSFFLSVSHFMSAHQPYQKTELSNLSSDLRQIKRKSTMIWCNHCAQVCRIRAEAGFLTCNSCGKILGEFAKGKKKKTDLGMGNISEASKKWRYRLKRS